MSGFEASSARLSHVIHARSLLPWRHVAFETSLTPDALRIELGLLVERGHMGSGWQLTMTGEHFRMTRQATRWGSSQTLAVVTGTFASIASGSRVVMTVRSPASAIAFFVYFAASAVAGGIAASVSAVACGSIVSLLVCVLFACVMPVFAWSIVAWQFVPEVRLAENFLRSAFPPASPSTGPFR